VRLGRRGTAIALLAAGLGACASPTAPAVDGGGPGAAASAGPRFSPGGPDAEAHGAGDGYPIAVFYRQPFLVGAFSHEDQLWERRVVRKPAAARPLARAPREPALRYEYQGAVRTLDDYLARHPITGFLLAQGDTILVERYQYARHDRHRFASFSMAKTVTALLVGIAIAEGRIRSVDDPAGAYVPALAGTEYGRTSLRHLLQMSSGVRFVERYDGSDDAQRLHRDTVLQASRGGAEAVMPYTQRLRRPGTAFAYASAETQVLGVVLRAVTGRPVAEYLRETIWEPMGAEADAAWIVDRAGQEATYCCFGAVLRDYARLGLLLAHDGRLGDRQLVPAAWLRAATTVQPDDWHLKPYAASRSFGYGYQTWIFPGPRRMFALLGLFGQGMYVDPQSRLVLVHTAVRPPPAHVHPDEEVLALWQAVVASLGAEAR
jgi:CubicO group peptidase (beta-lactamase class C family)